MSDCYIVRKGGTGGALLAVNAPNADALTAYAPDGTLGIISGVAARMVYAANEAPGTPIHGDIWVLVGAASAAPIRKGAITVYPTSARQYQRGSWIGVTCYVRSNGAWVPLEMELYGNGDFHTALTGGWAGATYSNAGYALESVFEGQPAMRMEASQNYDFTKTGAAVLYTRNKIPVGGSGRLVVRYYKSDQNGRIAIGLSANQACAAPELASTGLLYGEEDQWAVAEVDLAEAQGEAFVKIYIHAPGNNDAEIVYVTDVYLTD